mmetsp:Transcript_42654/g.132994  ORF Transcript_42654/g.132994 Transcript_42654/m.132994 type:complete len:343 (+) Transcript_42654:66-1094(+)
MVVELRGSWRQRTELHQVVVDGLLGALRPVLPDLHQVRLCVPPALARAVARAREVRAQLYVPLASPRPHVPVPRVSALHHGTALLDGIAILETDTAGESLGRGSRRHRRHRRRQAGTSAEVGVAAKRPQVDLPGPVELRGGRGADRAATDTRQGLRIGVGAATHALVHHPRLPRAVPARTRPASLAVAGARQSIPCSGLCEGPWAVVLPLQSSVTTTASSAVPLANICGGSPLSLLFLFLLLLLQSGGHCGLRRAGAAGPVLAPLLVDGEDLHPDSLCGLLCCLRLRSSGGSLPLLFKELLVPVCEKLAKGFELVLCSLEIPPRPLVDKLGGALHGRRFLPL